MPPPEAKPSPAACAKVWLLSSGVFRHLPRRIPLLHLNRGCYHWREIPETYKCRLLFVRSLPGNCWIRTFQTYRQNFILFAGISALPHVCLLAMQLCLLAGRVGGPTGSPGKLALFAFVVAICTIFVSLVVSSIATAATTFGVSDVYLDKQTSISACFARVKGKVGRVIYASMELGARVGIGFLLLIVPGIYWAGKYGLAVPAVVLEDIKGKQACARSAELTKDSVGRIVAIYFLTWMLVVAISAGIGAALGLAAPRPHKDCRNHHLNSLPLCGICIRKHRRHSRHVHRPHPGLLRSACPQRSL